MNKLLTKVAKLVLGLSLAAGVGVAVGSKAVERVDAVDSDVLTLQNVSGTSGDIKKGSTTIATFSAPDRTTNKAQWRLAANKDITITPSSGYVVNSITFTTNSTTTYMPKGNYVADGGSSTAFDLSSDTTASISSLSVSSQIVLTVSTEARITEVSISYTESGGGGSSGTTTNFTLSSASSVTKDGVIVTFAKASGGTAPTWYAAGLRLYNGNTVTVTCSANITSISFDWEKQGSKTFASCAANVGSYTHPSNTGTGTWTGSATQIVFTLSGSSAQLQLNTFSVVHENVSIVYATDIDIDQSTSSMNITSTLSLTATLTPAAPTVSTVSWSSSNTDILKVSASGVVTAVGEGTAVITATADGSEVENAVQDTLEITVSVDNAYDYCDVINHTLAGIDSNSYTAWSEEKTATNASHSSAGYSGKTNYTATNDMGLNDASGNGIIVSTSAGLAKKVVVVWNSNTTSGHTLNIYGSNSALSLSSLGSATETIVYGTSTEATLNSGNGYRYLGFNSSNGACYISSIIIYWDESASAALDLSGTTSASVGDSVVYTATRSNSSATIDWYVGETKQNSGISVNGDTSTFTYTASSAGTFTIKAQLNGTEIYQTKTLVVTAVEKYSLVTDLSQLTDGNKVLLGANVDDKTYIAKTYVSGNNVKSVETTVDANDKITKTAEMSAMTLSATTDGYTLKDESNYYLYAASSSGNQLKGETTLDSHKNGYWTIDLDNGDFSVVASHSSNRNVMQFNSDSGVLAFSCYASASQTSIQLYVLDANPSSADRVSTFGKLFLHTNEIALVTSETGIAGTDCIDNDYYLNAKSALTGGWSTIISALQSDSTGVGLRYAAWARAYGDTTPYASTVGSGAKLALNINGDNSSTITLIVIISMVSVTAIGGYFFIRRRKVN